MPRAARHRRHGGFLPQDQPRGGALARRRDRSAWSPRWRRRRIRAFPASSPRSRRTSASASTCPIATPPPARSRPRRRPAPSDPILDQPLLDFYAGYQVRSRRQRAAASPCRSTTTSTTTAAIVTWIDNLAGERPYGNDLDPTLNLDVLEVSFRNCALEDPRDAVAARDRATHHRLPAAARRERRVRRIRARTSIICRSSIRPISAAAMPPSRACRRPTQRSDRSGRHVLG